ncbi:MAG: UvrD-helicase domain-containing protein [Treponema sp.]|jgi:ATP-dependent helicase/nuclease subunit A|nr:UvrD-helicase domain-containing protein [Treponema sp.]
MEPNKNRTELNSEQREAAFCTENAVVAAGAGSGKTMVLANRFAWLVTGKNCSVEEILTLTFTRKAAAQMYRRIHSLLAEIAAEDTGIRGERARQALGKFTRARIQTLDSYSAALVKQAAPRYGISPAFTVDEERCRRLAIEEALPFLISRRHHPAIERLYAQQGPEGIAHSVLAEAVFNYSHIDNAPRFIEDVKKQFEVVRTGWEKERGNILRQLNKLADMAFDNKELLPGLCPLMNRFKNQEIFFPVKEDLHGYFHFLLEVPPGSAVLSAESHPIQGSITGILEYLAEINGLNLRKGIRQNNPAKELIKELRGMFGEFSSLAVFCLQAGIILSVMSLLDDLQRRYLDKKRAEGVLTFDDVGRLARTILLEQHDIRQSEKENFKAIMIDEFQDNNELQKDLLFLLAEKNELMNTGVPAAKDLSAGKLFFVGDEKQSIYRFRGADVSVFRKLKDELHSRNLPLRKNYRSAPLLIGAFNAIFGGGPFDPEGNQNPPEYPPVFAANPGLPLFEAAYTSLQAGKGGGGKLTICIHGKKNEDDTETGEAAHTQVPAVLPAVENEARFVAERIQRLLGEIDENGAPKYQPGDIAILFRSRSPQHLFEKHLRQLNIPYASENMNGFFHGGPVNDIMSVLRLAAYPLDRAAYAEMLRSPFAGVSLPGLAVCLSVPASGESPQPFDDRPLPLLSGSDQCKYRHGQNIYNIIREKAACESVSSLVSELWYNQGYRYETEWNSQTLVYRELYDYLFHLAAQADAENRGLAAFTASMQSLRDSGGGLHDIEIPLEHSGAVHLLTVHKSKGLEFPVVFLCCCDRHSQRSGGDDIFDTGSTGITFNPPLPPNCRSISNVKRNFFGERSLAEEKMKKTAELRRLLYVGMTRAEKELYLSGCLGIENESGSADFSQRLKQYVDEKMNRNTGVNPIPGDTILDNDSFFGLCLPALASRIPPEGLAGGGSFFDIEAIPVYQEEYIRESENRDAVFSNDQDGLNAFFAEAEPFYLNAEVISTPFLRNNHLTPTSLRIPDSAPGEASITGGETPGPGGREQFKVSGEFSGDDASDVFEKVDSLLCRYADREDSGGGKFNWGGFGTIAHICANALLSGIEAVIPPSLASLLDPEAASAFLEAGKELAVRFVRSPLGVIAKNAKLRKNEFPFRTIMHDSAGNEFFTSGTIDLLFEDEDTIHVVDFKTDSKEDPSGHAVQMACYYRAAFDLFAEPSRKKCQIWLYYLRSGHAVEMTKKVKTLNLERIISG